MLGGKNGYTVAAEASYVGAANRNGHTIIVAVMRDQPNFWPEAQALLNWGFAADGHGRRSASWSRRSSRRQSCRLRPHQHRLCSPRCKPSP